MLLAAAFSSRLASDALIKQSFDQLQAIQSLRSDTIEDFFQQRLISTRTVVFGDKLLELVQLLASETEKSNVTEQIYAHRSYWTNYIWDNGYSDFIILNADDGKMLFSLEEYTQSGRSISVGKSDAEGLKKAWLSAINTDNVSFTDFGQSRNKSRDKNSSQVAYFSAPVKDKNGQLLAVMVLEIPPKLITNAVDSRDWYGGNRGVLPDWPEPGYTVA